MTEKVNYKLEDLAPVSASGRGTMVLAINSQVPAKTLKEFIDYAKANPGKLNYGSPGSGSVGHLVAALFVARAGIDIVHVPYKGGGPAMADLLGGQIPVGIVILSNVLPQAKAGKVKLLAVLEAQRARAAPDTPTVAEAGVAGFAVPDTWVGMVGPARLPPAIVTAMHGALVKALQASDVRSRLEAAGFEVKSGTPEEFAELLTRSFETYRRITSEAGIKPE